MFHGVVLVVRSNHSTTILRTIHLRYMKLICNKFIQLFFFFIYREELPYYCLIPVSILFLEGFWIKVASIKQKNAFLANPEDSSFSSKYIILGIQFLFWTSMTGCSKTACYPMSSNCLQNV